MTRPYWNIVSRREMWLFFSATSSPASSINWGRGEGRGGGIPLDLGWGCAAECLGTWPCSRLKRHNFTTVPDKMVKIPCSRLKNMRRGWPPNRKRRVWVNAAGPEREQQQRSFAARFWPQKSNPDRAPGSEWRKVHPVPDRNADLLDTVPDTERQKPHPAERHIPV